MPAGPSGAPIDQKKSYPRKHPDIARIDKPRNLQALVLSSLKVFPCPGSDSLPRFGVL